MHDAGKGEATSETFARYRTRLETFFLARVEKKEEVARSSQVETTTLKKLTNRFRFLQNRQPL
jgi:hypothetical protein